MPEFKTTAKGVDAPFVKRTASPVEILGTEYAVHFTKGENGKGWRAFASASLDSANASGKTLDVSVLALKSHMEDVATADAMGSDVSKGEPVAQTLPVDDDDDTPKGEDVETETAAPEMAAAEISAHGLKVIRDARDAFTDYAAHGNGATVANRAAMEACTKIGELSQMITDDDRRARFYDYGTKLAEHYYGRTGGGEGILTTAQRKRAFQKFGKVCAELAA